MASSHFNYGQQDFKTTSQGGTDPAGRPQPGAGNAGDQDKPRKSPAGPRTAAEKRALSTRKKLIGKRAATEKLSSARGRKAARLAQPAVGVVG